MFADRRREGLDRLREVARRRAALALLVFGQTVVVAVSACLALPPLYRAGALLAVDPGRNGSELPVDLSARLATISQRVLSRAPLLEQARRFGLYPELAERGLLDTIVDEMKSDVRLE